MGKEKFSCTGKTLISAGFTKAVTWQELGKDETLPDVNKGDSCHVDDVSIIIDMLILLGNLVRSRLIFEGSYKAKYDTVTYMNGYS